MSNFKAFRELDLPVDGRHLLIFGPNGSGKSSLYYALYTLLESARKSSNEVSKYFDASENEHLLNLHELRQPAPKPGSLAVTLRDKATGADNKIQISQTEHQTHNQQIILRGGLASDFVTYRFFFGFSHFKNSETFNIWPLFESEILPFCVSTTGQNPADMWKQIVTGDPNPAGHTGRAGAKRYSRFKRNTETFAAILPEVVDQISVEAQRFYEEYFSHDDSAKVVLKLAITTPPSFSGTTRQNSRFTRPVLQFGVQIGGQEVHRPQTYLNEAKMTQMALSVRFAASLVNLHESELKLLVLDDLLVSLDMSNRIRVVEILLSDGFADYQKVVLTHDLGFFREFRRKIGTTHSDWQFLNLEGDAASTIEAKPVKTEIEKAEDHLNGHDLEDAAVHLRLACEETASRYLNRDTSVDPTKKFMGLQQQLRTAKKRLYNELPSNLYQKVLQSTPAEHRELLVSANDDDIETNLELDDDAKRNLKIQRGRLRQLLSTKHVQLLHRISLIDEILACTDRVLNPAAHADNPPLYKKEVKDALELVKKLENALAT